jgi:protein-tyrosine-phosphatase
MIISLCTGNAARSVMLGALLGRRRPELDVVTAGTHVIDGQPISRRTRAGLADLGLQADDHRSRQLDPADLGQADVVIGMAHEHVAWIRRHHPEATDRVVTIRALTERLTAGSDPLVSRVRNLDLASWTPEPAEDVVDPAGGEEDDYVRCARELAALTEEVAARL